MFYVINSRGQIGGGNQCATRFTASKFFPVQDN